MNQKMVETHSGGCACGAVRYRVLGKPVFATVCHCKFCQRRLASAFAVIATFDEQSVEIIQGELSECEHRSDKSGRWLRMRFCPNCGTTVLHTAEIRPGMRSIVAGTFDDTDWFAIERHLGTVEAALGLHAARRRRVPARSPAQPATRPATGAGTMIDHIGIAVGDFEVSKQLYAKALAPIGYSWMANRGEFRCIFTA